MTPTFPEPDWSDVFTSAEDLETAFRGFKFKGPGWYCMQGDYALILPDVLDRFKVSVWYYDPRPMMKQLVDLVLVDSDVHPVAS